MVREIRSPLNTFFKQFLALERAKGIRRHGRAILSGERVVREVLRDFPELSVGLIFSKGHQLPEEVKGQRIELYHLAPPLFEKLDFHGTGYPLLLVLAEPLASWNPAEQIRGCSLCIPFQDPTNVGAVIRSACAFGVSRIIILREAANPYLPKATRASAGSLFRISLLEGPSIYDLPKVAKAPLIGLSQSGVPIEEFEFPESFCLVPGMEGPGLPPDIGALESVSIPMAGEIESLNAAVAASIALYVWRARIGSK